MFACVFESCLFGFLFVEFQSSLYNIDSNWLETLKLEGV